jgi:hypothetical protein
VLKQISFSKRSVSICSEDADESSLFPDRRLYYVDSNGGDEDGSRMTGPCRDDCGGSVVSPGALARARSIQ